MNYCQQTYHRICQNFPDIVIQIVDTDDDIPLIVCEIDFVDNNGRRQQARFNIVATVRHTVTPIVDIAYMPVPDATMAPIYPFVNGDNENFQLFLRNFQSNLY